MSRYRLGSLEIDEATRRLSIAGADVSAQPLLYAFLVFLLRNSDRAVSKDELLQALWPGVTVAESSLQRVASLARGLLRRSGAEAALESVQRFGYRLRPEKVTSTETLPADGSLPVIDAARAACAARRWRDAADLFARGDGDGPLAAVDLEKWGLSLECIGRPRLAIDPLTRAVTAHVAAGDRLAAAHPALALSRIHLERAEMDVARGWHSRAGELIGSEETSPERGLWCWMGSRLAAAAADTAGAQKLANRAYEIGQASGDPVVESLGLTYRGFFALCLGDTARGLADQNLAATLGLSSQIDPVVGSAIYCNLLWACRNFADWTRANHWSASYERWCRTIGLEDLTGSCRLHRAEVIGINGTLAEAKVLIVAAIAQLEQDAPWAIGDAARVLGDLHLAADEFDEAERSYERAMAAGWMAQPGLALLQFERGDHDAAIFGLERCLRNRTWPALQRRGVLLATLAKISALTGRHERAREINREFETQPGRWPMPSIRALTAESRAELHVASGDLSEAIAELQLAAQLWIEAGAVLSAAETRLRLAGLLAEAGDIAGANVEANAARLIAQRTASPRLARLCRAFSEAPEAGATAPAR